MKGGPAAIASPEGHETQARIQGGGLGCSSTPLSFQKLFTQVAAVRVNWRSSPAFRTAINKSWAEAWERAGSIPPEH